MIVPQYLLIAMLLSGLASALCAGHGGYWALLLALTAALGIATFISLFIWFPF